MNSFHPPRTVHVLFGAISTDEKGSLTRLIRAELLKLRTTRLSYGLLATAAGLTALFSVLEASRAGSGKAVAPLYTAAGFNAVITGGVWALLLATVLGVTVSSGEFRHATATQTYLATPRRGRVMAAKAVAAACAGAVFGLAAGGATVLVSSHILAEVAQTVDSVVILDRGRLVAQSSLADLTAGAGNLEDAFFKLTREAFR